MRLKTVLTSTAKLVKIKKEINHFYDVEKKDMSIKVHAIA